MFYAQLVLAKKGALGKVWLAAHWDRKLTKTQINSTDISKSVESIMNPVAPFALRLTAHLLLGVVRIYSRKVKYLLSDCTDALTKIKMAFRPGMVDLPPDANVAAINSITLPEHAADIDLNMPYADDITLESFGDEVATVNTALWGKITLPPVRPASPLRTEIDHDPLDVPDDDEMFPSAENLQSAEKLRRDSGFVPQDTPVSHFDEGFGGMDIDFPQPDFDTPRTASMPPTPGSRGDSMRQTPMTEQFPLGLDEFVERMRGTPVELEVEQPRPDKGKKRIKVDENTELSSRFIKEQLTNTGPITREMVLAPVTKKALLRKEREQDVHTLYRITNIEGLASELLDLFALSMIDGPRDVPTPDKLRKELDQSPSTTPFTPLPMYDEGPPLSPTIDAEIPETGSRPISPTTEIDTSYTYNPDDEGELPPPVVVEEDQPWSERTKKMHAYLDKTFGDNPDISYLGLVSGKKVHTVAGTFFELLVLKSRNLIDLEQDEPYADIRIKKTEHFYDPQQ